jgi:hypothetical protein
MGSYVRLSQTHFAGPSGENEEKRDDPNYVTVGLPPLEYKGDLSGPELFRKELDTAGWEIFELQDWHGFHAWRPGGIPYKKLSQTTVEEIRRNVVEHATPRNIVQFQHIELPHRLPVSKFPIGHDNKYPYQRIGIGDLYVATQYRGLDLHSYDFVFHSNMLEALARRRTSGDCMMKIPGTNTLMSYYCADFKVNYAEQGHKFERFVTGVRLDYRKNSAEFVRQMITMKIGDYKILFCSQPDAKLGNDIVVECKIVNPEHWGTKTMFQMIASASPKMCSCIIPKHRMIEIAMIDLHAISRTSFREQSRETLEANILEYLDHLKQAGLEMYPGEIRELAFAPGPRLRLAPPKVPDPVFLPAAPVVRELLGT